jgi:hypothetical protein
MTSVSYYESSIQKSTQRSGSLSLSGAEATYRIYSDALDMAVCAACADEARKLRIGVEPLSRQ